MLRALVGCLALFTAWIGGVAPARANSPGPKAQLVQFPSEDGLLITGNLYKRYSPAAPMVVLFHQAGGSRGEYLEIAPRLSAMGINALAVDARSGGSVKGVDNQTHQRARRAGKATDYISALPDLRAALRYARKVSTGRVIAWGSSYSAALVLHLAGQAPQLVDAILAFSPGEYFIKLGKASNWVMQSARKIRQPVFITSAKREKQNWWGIYRGIPSKAKQNYVPKTPGHHGSRALWSRFRASEGYWRAVRAFLHSIQAFHERGP